MWIWAISATVVCLVIIGIFIAYRRQVKKTCRQLAFMKKNRTNMRLRAELPFSELNELSDNINGLLDSSDKIRITAERNEQNLKEAITNISHDIRTPLTSLDGFFHLMKNSDSQEERVQCTEIIQNRIDNLKYMLEELFTYTKLQNEDYTIQLETIDFNKCVCSGVVGFYNEFQDKGIEVSTDFTEDEIILNGNSEAVQRIVQNVLKNVLDHGSREVEMTLKADNDKAVFTCSNKVENPESIDVSQVFSRFYKSDPARTHSSTGLGLAIAKGLAKRMNGDVTAEIEGDMFKIRVVLDKI